MDDAIRPFRIDIPAAELDDLRDRLARTRWPDQLPDVGWDYGIALDDVRELAEYWRTTYDWRVFEDRLNSFPQFTTEIDGQAVHFLQVRSAAPGALPLIMTHGWPGSVVEFMEVIGPLTDPGTHGGDPGDAFDLVVPSIPGFGFSGPTRERGWNVQRVARAWDELMGRLGYERYGAQGGDWGSSISRELGVLAPERVIGVHLNTLTQYVSGEPVDLSERDRSRIERLRVFRRTGSGYGAIQATRPQTVGYGLTDSPAGQLAWIAEKFGEWTDGGLGAVDRDQMLTNITVYWLTRTAGSSARLYYEAVRSGALGPPAVSTAPTGVAVFPAEIAPAVRPIAEQSNHIVHWSEFDRGGHFAAMEEPDLLIGDVREFFRLFRPAYRVEGDHRAGAQPGHPGPPAPAGARAPERHRRRAARGGAAGSAASLPLPRAVEPAGRLRPGRTRRCLREPPGGPGAAHAGHDARGARRGPPGLP